MPKDLDFLEKQKEITNVLEREKSIVIATADGERVAARTVYYVFLDESIYFYTSTAYTKYKQILKNQNVALCLANIQIEGVAHSLGHPSLQSNKAVLDCFALKCPEGSHYAKYKNSVLIQISISKIETWNNGGREYLNLEKKTAYRIG